MTATLIRENILSAPLTYTTEIRAAGEAGDREFEGLGVPYDVVIDLGWGELEAFDRGSIELHDQIPLVLWQHDRRTPIGVIIPERCAETAAGYQITGRLSTTPAAEDAYTLLRDGVITRLSIGFQPGEYRVDEDGIVHWTKVTAREWSLVSFPAYDDAAITAVRSAPTAQIPTKENTMPDTDTIDLAAQVTELSRSIDQLRGDIATGIHTAPRVDHRSAGEILRALVAGDTETVRSYENLLALAGIGGTENRDYDGGTIADAISQNAWVGSLVHIFDQASGVLSNYFSTGPLPATGMKLEYGQLDANTITVTEQIEEGDPIPFGNVKLKTETTDVHTYAGGTELTRKEIERSTNVNILDAHLQALAIAAGARQKAAMRAAYNALVTKRTAIEDGAGMIALGKTLAASTVDSWENALVDAAIMLSKLSLNLDGLLVSASVFKKLRGLTVAGDRVFVVDEGNHTGTLDLPGLRGRMANLPVELDPDQDGDSANFADKRALRSYNSAVVSLTDEALINLTKQFAVYRYGAVADEIPAGLVPVKFGA